MTGVQTCALPICDEVMWLKYGLEYKYDLNFDMTSGQMTKFSASREYDVDWNGGD